MSTFLVAAAVLTAPTVLLAGLVRLGLALLRRPAPRFWRRTLKWNAALYVLHVFLTMPLVIALLNTWPPATRADERDYAGPRLAPDGTWLVQSQESLRAEASGEQPVDGAILASARERAVTFTSSDGVGLRAFIVPPRVEQSPPSFSAVLVHGKDRGALELEPPGDMFRDLGGEVLLLEWRNHGGSERAPFTWGRDESLDVLAAVRFLRARPEAGDRPLVLFGDSAGSAVVALAAPRVTDLGGLVLDAPIDGLGSRVRDSMPDPWASTVLFLARYLRGIPVEEVKPVETLRQLPSEVVVLLVGEGRDHLIPPESVRAFYEALPQPSENRRLWIAPEATHAKAWLEAPDEYARHLDWFIGRVLALANESPP